MDKLLFLMGTTCGSWLIMYLFVGWVIARDEWSMKKRLMYTFGWMFLPVIYGFFQEEPEDYGVEGNCTCKRRRIEDAGGKYCSVCGGKIKDKLWKRK